MLGTLFEMVRLIADEMGYDMWLSWYLDGVTSDEYLEMVALNGGIGGHTLHQPR